MLPRSFTILAREMGKFIAQLIDFRAAEVDPVALLEDVEKKDWQLAATIVTTRQPPLLPRPGAGNLILRAPPEPTIMSPAIGFAATQSTIDCRSPSPIPAAFASRR
jgi:hypothetical protein